jgi:hypothetical protein
MNGNDSGDTAKKQWPSDIDDTIRHTATYSPTDHRYADGRLPTIGVEVLNEDTLIADGKYVFMRVN